ncbi:PapD pilus/flagellar-assembly chaperone N-terminal domain [Bacteriovorax sp. BAL6_X]|uniref:fimbrial biogenesis chaperone n=1 Tax=Bacteriovorax sp. BAL6_X TaxID=1201290 RepID=UPI000385EA5C|nr:fimbria/pilus periplasmic chaperone [Bacteriovorax sp. BAL6_X]EPZ52366.1 PapD pilus/flagellar-assembly chaperone N-terminal domain [Bacteriovorax sp. BAL6_X]
MRILVLLTIAPLLLSFTFRPTSQTIDISSGQKSTQFQIENTSSEMIPVTINVLERIQKEDGSESLPKTSDVSVFPPQLIVSPGDRKTIRVDWKGGSNITTEKVFRIVAEQVPLKRGSTNSKNRGGIKMLLKYMNVLYVTKKEFQSKLVASHYEVGKKIRVYITNKGKSHQYLKNVRFEFIKGDKKLSIPAKDMIKLDGQNILANTTRFFIFENTINLKNGYELRASFGK